MSSTYRTPVVFIHGLWLHATSWATWASLFGDAGSGGDLAPMRDRARAFLGLAADFGRRAATEPQR